MAIDPAFRALGFYPCGDGQSADLFVCLMLGPGFRRDQRMVGEGAR